MSKLIILNENKDKEIIINKYLIRSIIYIDDELLAGKFLEFLEKNYNNIIRYIDNFYYTTKVGNKIPNIFKEYVIIEKIENPENNEFIINGKKVNFTEYTLNEND